MHKHFILTLGRSGSNTLASMLNQHPSALNLGEVLGPWTRVQKLRRRLRAYGGDDARFLDAMLRPSAPVRALLAARNAGRLLSGRARERKRLGAVETIGVKDFATLLDERGLRPFLRDRSDIKVVGLVRSDPLDRTISWKMLDSTGVVSTSKARGGHRTLEIPPQELLDGLRSVQAENQLLADMLGEIPEARRHVVSYDDLYRDERSRRSTVEGIFAFLGLEPVEISIKMHKIIRQPASQVIGNREECARHLAGTEFEGILDPGRGAGGG